MPSPVQSNCDANDTIANGQYGAVWSMGHTQQVCVRIVLLPSNVWQQFFGRSAFLRQQETDLPPAELTQLIIPEKRRRYDFDQSRRVLLSSNLHSISVLMAQMETDPPDITNSCEERNRFSLEIEALDIVINLCTELVNFPDTNDNHEMKAILRASIDDTQRKKDTMVSELRSLSPCMTFNCNGNYCAPPLTPTEKHKDSDSNHILKNYSEAPTNANNAKNKKKKIHKINKKDSVEDFVFPKKTARPVSPLPNEPVTVNNSFSDLESENDKDQVAPEENNETEPPKPKPSPQFILN
ncbi:hypothetical protein TNCV_984381 [Trichonephila clavipes]|nr:hypothetical protein TNCV_984381 [Trichonephila clavipes]